MRSSTASTAGPRPHTREAGEATRRRLLDAALRAFAADGYEGVSVRRLCADAQANVAAVSHHFGDKQGLYDAVIAELYDALAAVAPPAGGEGDDPVAALVAGLWSLARAHELHVRLLHRHLLDHGDLPARSVAGQGADLLGLAAGWVGVARPGATAEERALIVQTLLHLVVRFLLEPPEQFLRLTGPEADRDRVVPAWLAHVARALLSAPAWSLPGAALR